MYRYIFLANFICMEFISEQNQTRLEPPTAKIPSIYSLSLSLSLFLLFLLIIEWHVTDR